MPPRFKLSLLDVAAQARPSLSEQSAAAPLPPAHLRSPVKVPPACCPGQPAAASDWAFLFGFGFEGGWL